MAHVFEKKWRSEDVRLRENVDFSALLLPNKILEGLKKAGFKKPSPIQLEAIPVGRLGKDLMVQAKSGTGKTLVFVIVALDMLKRKLFRPQVLVIVPTREIATQICTVVKTVGSTFPNLTCNSFIGGLPIYEDQEKAVTSQIIVGTPGRLKQLISMKSLPTNSIRLLVFDEADELLHSNSFKDEIDEIFTSLPDVKQVIATSATFNQTHKKLLFRYLRDPHLVRLNLKQIALLGMINYAVPVEFCPMPMLQYRIKLDALQKILKTVEFAQCLLFCNGVQRVEILYRDLKKWGFSTAYISSAKDQCDRLKAIERLKRFKCKVLVSSDLTSRGIDAENVDLIVNFDLPYTTEVYMHRVGRAGRYGTVGVAITILNEDEKTYLHKMEKGGSFKTYKLPDPIPKDLILYPVVEDFLIEEVDTEEVNCSETDKSSIVKPNTPNRKARRQACAKSVTVKEASESTVHIDDGVCKNGLSESASNTSVFDTQPDAGITLSTVNYEAKVENAANDVHSVSDIADVAPKGGLSKTVTFEDDYKSDDDITMPATECQVKVEEVVGDISRSVDFNEDTADKLLQNGSVFSNDIKLSKSTDSDLLNDCVQSKLVDIEATENLFACNTQEKGCEEHAIINDNMEEQDLKSQLSDVSDSEKKNVLNTERKILNDAHSNPVSELSEIKDTVENTENGSVHFDKVFAETSDTLNKIKAFVDSYELSKSMEVGETKNTFHIDCQPSENSGEKLITIDMINNLKSRKNEFFYKTLKAFQEKKEGVLASHENVKEVKNEKSNEDMNVSPENAKMIAEPVSAEVNPFMVKLPESPKIENREAFSEKPNFESTPHLDDKIVEEVSEKRPIILGKFDQEDESDFDDSDANEEVAKQDKSVDSAPNSLTSESESGSLSCGSESDSSSGSETSSDSSSTSSEKDVIYHHNYSHTGRQNPSLIFESLRNQIHRGHTASYSFYYPNNVSPSNCATMHHIPPQSAVRYPAASRWIDRLMAINRNASVPFSEENSSYFRPAYQPVNARGNSSSSTRDFQASSGQSLADRYGPLMYPKSSLEFVKRLMAVDRNASVPISEENSSSGNSSCSTRDFQASRGQSFVDPNMPPHLATRHPITASEWINRHMSIDRNASAPFSEENSSYIRPAYQPVNATGNSSCSRQDVQASREQSFADPNMPPMAIDLNASVPFSEENSSYFRPAYQPVNARGNSSCFRRDFQASREQGFDDPSITYFPRRHSRCCRSMNSTRGITREDQNRRQNQTRRSSSRCRHTLRCFLPTQHRCHPNTPVYPCNQPELCEMWYEAFYNQWLHIQNVIH